MSRTKKTGGQNGEIKSKAASSVTTKPLATVKDARVTKPAQTSKAKSKELAKSVAAKQNGTDKKKSKKAKKEPTPVPESESEEESDDTSASSVSSDESEAEAKVVAAKSNGLVKADKKGAAVVSSEFESSEDESDAEPVPATKAAPVKINGSSKVSPAVATAADSEDEDSDSDASSEESDDEAGVPIVANAAAAVPGNRAVSDESDESEDDSEEDEAPAKVNGVAKANGAIKKSAAEEESDDSEDDSEGGSEDDSDASEESVVAEAAPTKKRKADAVATPVSKKTKTETASGANEGVRNLFVGGLSWNVDEDWLSREFEGFGEITSARVITDRNTGKSKGFGYVEFANAADAAKAHAEKNGAMLDGRNMNVDFATPRGESTPVANANSRADRFGDTKNPPADTLFVGNISFEATEEIVTEAFGEYGTITSVRLPTDMETGNPKGFGYVSFSTVEEAQSAMDAMAGADIAGRAVRLDFATPRTNNGDSPRGRGGFGDRGGRGGGRGRGGFGDRGRGRGGFSDRGRGRGGFGGDRGRGGSRGGSTNRGGFGDFKGKKVTF